jgi:hypothetical protein
MNILRFVEIALASWFLAFALTNTHGPGGIFEWVREHVWHGRTKIEVPTSVDGKPYTKWIPGKNGLLDCIICLIPWIALGLWLLPDGVVTWALASAGLGLAVHSSSGWRYGG